MSSYALFTSESVSEGHPDKVSDQVSDAILDLYLAKDPNARVAVETLVKTGMAVVAGEVTSSATVTPGEIENTIRNVICDIGYDSSDVCFDGNTCAVINAIGLQSADIAMGTHEADEANQGAGDQGLMFGYAANETDTLMPAPIYYSHRLVEKQAELRRSGAADFLRPDAKSQISVRYEDGKPVAVDAVVLSTQHSPDIEQEALRAFVKREIIEAVLPTSGSLMTPNITSTPPVSSSLVAQWATAGLRDGRSLSTLMAAWRAMVAVPSPARIRPKSTAQLPTPVVTSLKTSWLPALLIAAKFRSLTPLVLQSPHLFPSIPSAQLRSPRARSSIW